MRESRNSPDLMDRCRAWLRADAFPLWFRGQPGASGFREGLSFQGEELVAPHRAIVQGRQIYCLRVAHDLGLMDKLQAIDSVRKGASILLSQYRQPDGSFAHSVHPDGSLANKEPDLYSQAFVLFGLANAQAVVPNPQWVRAAEGILDYLELERRASGGGFTECKGGVTLYQSNPHMHLFEAALYWAAVDASPRWLQLAAALGDLCESRFVDGGTGALGEHFTEGWGHLREGGRYVLEPGHHYEWAWLFLRHEALGGKARRHLAERLFTLAEAHGRGPDGLVIDEIWSDGAPKKASGRYWPQCERAKAALRLGRPAEADAALRDVFAFLQTELPGLCFDARMPDGSFAAAPPRASFLYHVANAMEEYLLLRASI